MVQLEPLFETARMHSPMREHESCSTVHYHTAMSRSFLCVLVWVLAWMPALPAQESRAREIKGIDEKLQLITDRLNLKQQSDVTLNAKWLDRKWRQIVAVADAKIAANEGGHRGHALKYLAYLELKRDRDAARKVAQRALADLGRTTQLILFIERALFVSPTDAEYRIGLKTLSATVPHERQNGRLRALHVQALLGSGKIKEAVVTNKNILADIGDDIRGLRALACALCEAPEGRSMAKLAATALDKAIAMQGESLAGLLLKYRVYHDLLRNEEEAKRLAEKIVNRVPVDDLNDWLWDLLAKRSNAGKFPSLALIAARRLGRLPAVGYQEYDTIALALFRNGFIDEAIESQRLSLESGGTYPDYKRRLRIYEQAKKDEGR